MTTRPAISNHYPPSQLPQQTSLAWLVIGALILLSFICYFGGAGSVLRLAFPLASFVVGIFLYVKYPVLYVGYTWWLWFLVSFMRRLIDYRYGWEEQGVILISPYLVSLITFATLIRYLPKSYRIGGLPFIMAIFAVFYGFLLGLVIYPPLVVFRTMLDWATPVLFGFHLFVNWRNYPEYRKNTQTVFLWGVLITGIYGIVQFLIAPEWDKFWLIHTKLTTFGHPEPLQIRVWSTLPSPGPFSVVIMAGLLILLSSESSLKMPASIAGYVTFLLTMVRSAWGGWVIGLLTLMSTLKPKLQMRLVMTILVMVMCIVPLVTIEPFSKSINERFESFTNIEKDQSYQDRSANYNQNITIALSKVLGSGIGGTWTLDSNGKLVPIVLDSGILDTFFSLGWFGAIPYMGGLAMLMYTLFQDNVARNDPFANAARSVSLGVIFQLIFGSVMLSLSGIVLWGFLGLAMAAKKYNQHIRNTEIKQI